LESPTTEAGTAAVPAQASEEVLVLDFGGQYSQLIARRIRECGVFAELLPSTTSVEAIRERRPKGLVQTGGPPAVYEAAPPAFPTEMS
jgi:GMP synthase (glutamine-hydrolysing)